MAAVWLLALIAKICLYTAVSFYWFFFHNVDFWRLNYYSCCCCDTFVLRVIILLSCLRSALTRRQFFLKIFTFYTKFRCCNQWYSYGNDSRYGLVRNQARKMYSCMRHGSQLSKISVAPSKTQPEDRFEPLDQLWIQPQLNSRKSDTIDCLENDDRCEEVLEFVVGDPECLLDVYSFSRSTKVEALYSIFWQQRLDLNSFREHVPSVANCAKIANRILQRLILNAQFQLVEVGDERNILYMKNAVEVLQKQLRIANFDKYIYIPSMVPKYEVGSV